ncbi:MAG: hypothetical protein HOY79_17910 [Streptomyces sp.]|nr:hypothetical protein [Streptomyces sp.]
MKGFKHGRKVLFQLDRTYHTGTIISRESLGSVSGWLINADGPRPGPWFAYDDDITAIPADAPILLPDTDIQITADAPYYAGRTGHVDSPAVRDSVFGYWLHLTSPKELAWAPAQALHVLTPSGGAR